jgi:hypothetical protein
MKRALPRHEPRKPDPDPGDARRIDLLYGLEPVIEPDSPAHEGDAAGSLQCHVIECPYCGERFETLLDTSAGSACYVEDCHVCCRPIEFNLEVDNAGVLVALSTLRSD